VLTLGLALACERDRDRWKLGLGTAELLGEPDELLFGPAGVLVGRRVEALDAGVEVGLLPRTGERHVAAVGVACSPAITCARSTVCPWAGNVCDTYANRADAASSCPRSHVVCRLSESRRVALWLSSATATGNGRFTVAAPLNGVIRPTEATVLRSRLRSSPRGSEHFCNAIAEIGQLGYVRTTAEADRVAAPGSFDGVYRANVAVVTAYFARRCSEPQTVADLTSETFLEAIGSFRTFDARKGSPRAWLFGIAATSTPSIARRQRTVAKRPFVSPRS